MSAVRRVFLDRMLRLMSMGGPVTAKGTSPTQGTVAGSFLLSDYTLKQYVILCPASSESTHLVWSDDSAHFGEMLDISSNEV